MKHFLYILYIAFSAALPARTLAEGGEGVPPCVKIAGEPTAAIYNRYNKEISSIPGINGIFPILKWP